MLGVTLLGTGAPLIEGPRRAGPSALVTYQRDDRSPVRHYLVDAGRWVTMRLAQAGVPWVQLDAVVFTHHHMDHTVGWADVLMTGWQMGRDRRWRVIGPPHTAQFCRSLEDAYEYDRARRSSMDSSDGGLHDVIEIDDAGVVLDEDGLRVTATIVPHGACVPSFAYRFDSAQRSIVISGDCRPSDALRSLAAGADVLVHEVMFEPAFRDQLQAFGLPESRQDQILSFMSELHTTERQLGELAQSTGARTLMLTHFMPGDFESASLGAAIAARYSGDLIVSEDLERA